MVSLKVKKGEFSNQNEYALFVDDILLFEGYNYELISTESGRVEFKMNQVVENNIINFKLTRFNDIVILIPNDYYKHGSKVPTLFMTFEELKKIWTNLGFSFEEDENLILQTTYNDIKDCWLNTFNSNQLFYEKTDLIEYLLHNILAIKCQEIDMDLFVNLLTGDWEVMHKKILVTFDSGVKTSCIAYFEKEEWEFAFPLGDKTHFNIGRNYSVELEKVFSTTRL